MMQEMNQSLFARPKEDSPEEEEIPLAYVMLKTIAILGEAENEEITQALLFAEKNGVHVPGINFFYTPNGPSSPEVKSELGLSLIMKEVKQLSPAVLTKTGLQHLEELEKNVPSKTREDIIRSIKSIQR